MPKVSVIIPTYNRDMYINETIQCVLNQSYTDLELLIVDDGSRDNTKNIIEDSIKKDSRICYLVNENKKGPGGARNTGIKHSKSNYIAFLDSDDLWNEDNLKLKVEALENNVNIDAIFSDFYFFGNVEERYLRSPIIRGVFNPRFWAKYDNLDIALESIIPYILQYGFSFPLPSIVFKKELLLKINGFNENLLLYEDVEVTFKGFCLGKFAYINKRLCRIRRHCSNTSNIYSKSLKAESELQFTKNIVNFVKKCNLPVKRALLNNVLRDAYIRRSTQHIRNGNYEQAKDCLSESIRIGFCLKAAIRFLVIGIICLVSKRKT